MASVTETSPLNGSGALAPKNSQTTTFTAENKKSVTRMNLTKMRRICVFVKCATALFGFLLTILHTELVFDDVIKFTSLRSIVLKSFISLSTLALIGAVAYYHVCRHKLNVLDQKKIIIRNTIFLVAVEFLCCIVHPFPYEIIYHIARSLNKKVLEIDIDPFLTILMLLRIYLVPHLIYEFSSFGQNPIIKTMARIRKIRINVSFVFRYYIHRFPLVLIFSLLMGTILLSSWLLRVCEQQIASEFWRLEYRDWVYMTLITFLTIGYGDVLPDTSCGRTMAVITGLAGVGTIALLVAILVHLIGFSNSERVAVDSVSNPDRQKKYKTAAANAIKFYWLSTKLEQSELNKLKRKALRRKLRESVRTMRSLRSNETDNEIDVSEVYNLLQQVLKNQREMQAKLRM